jgi:hypothetical protein
VKYWKENVFQVQQQRDGTTVAVLLPWFCSENKSWVFVNKSTFIVMGL